MIQPSPSGLPIIFRMYVMISQRDFSRMRAAAVFAFLMLVVGSCTPSAFLNATVTRRGNNVIGFVNNTPFRANFTFGGYDPTDQNTVPVFSQIRIEGNTAAPQQSQGCRRTFSLGGAELERLIRSQSLTVTDEPVLHEDVFFSSAPAGDPLAADPTEGKASQMVILDGVDYTCEGLLLFVFEQDAASPGGFRIDYSYFNPT